MKLLSLSLIASLVLGACTSAPKPIPMPQKNRLPQEEVRQEYLKPDDMRRVRTGEFVKTYHLGRSVRGSGKTMHEAHRVYRLEKPSRWNLTRDQPPLSGAGPVNKIVDTAFKPAPESKAITAELNRQRELSEELEAAQTAMQEVLTESRNRLQDSTTQIAALGEARRRIAELEAELRQLRHSAPSEVPEDVEEVPANALKAWGEKQP